MTEVSGKDIIDVLDSGLSDSLKLRLVRILAERLPTDVPLADWERELLGAQRLCSDCGHGLKDINGWWASTMTEKAICTTTGHMHRSKAI